MLGTVAAIPNSDAIPLRIAILLAFVIPLLNVPKMVNGSISIISSPLSSFGALIPTVLYTAYIF